MILICLTSCGVILVLVQLDCSLFFYFVMNNGLHQMVRNPTRDENILDILLTNENLAVINVTVLAPFSTSNHSSFSWYAWCIVLYNIMQYYI